ncbi:MAG: hypothetical protein WKG01_40470 [Kofleriaceae bacterium]
MRPPPGPQLSSGRLRVDAARAIAKLREYQLANRAAWVLEAIRAAVASGAQAISVHGDANDLWLSWTGEPWSAADLPRLFDELVSPEATGERHHVRLLAAAVNSALGMNPAFVDVFAIAADGAAVRARYTPDVLDVSDTQQPGVTTALQRITVEPAPAPPRATGPGMAVHLRRRLGTEVLRYALLETPAELVVARAACEDIAVPLRVGTDELGRARHRHDLLREPLGSGVDGFVALIDPDRARGLPSLIVAERGVVLATSQLELGLGGERRHAPVRVFVDAPRMPTNASRSLVRHGEHPMPTALRRATEVLPGLLQQLIVALSVDQPPEPLRAVALALLAAVDPSFASPLDPQLEALAALPLVRDATGLRVPVRQLRGARLAHTGREPLPEHCARGSARCCGCRREDRACASSTRGGSTIVRPGARSARRSSSCACASGSSVTRVAQPR